MKLAMKLIAAPLLTAVVMFVAGQANTVLMTQAVNESQASSNASMEDFKTVANVQQQLGQVHASVYKTVALIASLDDAKVKLLRDDLARQLAGIKRVSAALAEARTADGNLSTAVADVGKQIDTYGKQADSAIDLSSVDPNTGIAAMQGADSTFAALSKIMADIAVRSEAGSQAVILASQQRANYTNLLLAIFGLGVAVAAVVLSWLMQRKLVAELAK